MNIQQLEYIVALDIHKNHVRAAEHCHVTQPTLSMMIKKLEDELGVKIFDRSSQPVKPTPVGEKIIAKSRQILSDIKDLRESVHDERQSLDGEFRMGVIPTLAPYLLPRFLNHFLDEHTNTFFTVTELQTDDIIRQLKNSQLDIGILVTPLDDKEIREIPIFYEPILVYTSDELKYYDQERVNIKSLTMDDLWLLEEGHCFRGQVMNLCSGRSGKMSKRLNYQSGSFETLKAMVDNKYGYTLIPELAVNVKSKHVKRFVAPEPVREVSIVVHQRFAKDLLIQKIQESILKSLPSHFRTNQRYVRIKWK